MREQSKFPRPRRRSRNNPHLHETPRAQPAITKYVTAPSTARLTVVGSGTGCSAVIWPSRLGAIGPDDEPALVELGGAVHLGALDAYLWHPMGGGSYARSYKIQKWVEQRPPGHRAGGTNWGGSKRGLSSGVYEGNRGVCQNDTLDQLIWVKMHDFGG